MLPLRPLPVRPLLVRPVPLRPVPLLPLPVRPPPVLVLPVHVLLGFATAILSREIIMRKRLRTVGRTVTKTVGMPVGALKARRDHKR